MQRRDIEGATRGCRAKGLVQAALERVPRTRSNREGLRTQYQAVDRAPSLAIAEAMKAILRQHLPEQDLRAPGVTIHLVLGLWEALRHQMHGASWRDRMTIRDQVLHQMQGSARAALLGVCLGDEEWDK